MSTREASPAGPQRTGDAYVFINYRREDSAGHAGRLHDDLVRHFSPEQVFIDLAAIPAGVEFAQSINEAVARCTALVALIGPRWLSASHPDGGRRLDDPNDYVRLEIEAALKRDVLVIPVLLQGTRMPRASDLPESLRSLAKRNSMEMRDASWRSDFETLAAGLSRAAAVSGRVSLRGESEAFWSSAPADVELPYLGLRPFEEEDARFFFGREDDVAALVERLKDRRFVAVFGPSGSGKSSLVRAGLVSAMRNGAIDDSRGWPIEIVRPGARPLDTLAARLHRLNPGRSMAELVDALAGDPRTIHLETTAILAQRPGATRFVWVIDQAEELFTLCHDEEQRRAAIANLIHAAAVADGPATVVIAMRADFYQRCAAYPELAAAVSTSQYLVSPLSEAGLRQAIEEPARAVGLEFEPGLVDTIVGDVLSQPGALPLLEHALFELFQRRRGVTLTLEGYRATGGVEGALANRAEAVYDDLEDEEKGVVRRVMLRLTQPGEGTVDTRRRSTLRDLPAEVDESEPVRHVVGELANARLLTVGASEDGGEPFVEIAHEALIRAWPRVREWIEQDRAALVLHRRIADATVEWQRLDGSEEVLLRGVRLAEATEWRARHADLLNDAERHFLEASIDDAQADARARERRRRRIYALATGLIVFFVVLSGTALLAWRESVTLLDRALAAESAANDTIEQLEAKQLELDAQRRIAVGRSLLAAARAEGTSFNLGMLLGLEGRRLAGSEANEFLLDELQRWAPLAEMRQVMGIETATATAVSPDLGTMAIAREESLGMFSISLRDMASGDEQPLAELFPLHRLAFSPDGTIVAASGSEGDDKGVFLWPVAGGRKVFLPAQTWSNFLAFSADGRRIATEASPDGSEIAVWDVQTAEELLRVETGTTIPPPNTAAPDELTLGSYALNGTGTRLAIEILDPLLQPSIDVWDVATGRNDVVIKPDGNERGGQLPLTFSAGADILVGARYVVVEGDEPDVRPLLRFWDLRGDTVDSVRLSTDPLSPTVAALAPDGSSFAAAGFGGLIQGKTGFSEDEGFGFTGGVSPFAIASLWFADGGSALVAHDGAGTVARWTTEVAPSNPTQARQVPSADSLGFIRAVGPQGQLAIVEFQAGVDPDAIERTFQIVDVESGERRDLESADGGAITFGPDGKLFLVSGKGGRLQVMRLTSALEWTQDASLPTAGTAAAISHDSRLVAVAAPAADGALASVQVWDLATGSEVGRATLASEPTAVAFTTDDRRLILATNDLERDRHSLATLDVAHPEEAIATFASGPGRIVALWSDDDGSVIGLSDRDLAMQWDLGTRLLTASGTIPRTATAPGDTTPSSLGTLTLASDGEVFGAGGGRVWLWSVADFAAQHLQPVETAACALAGRNFTQVEWGRYLPDEPYRRTCPGYPDGE